MRAAALILALATSATAFTAPRAAVAPRVAPVNMDASSLVTAYRELYEVGGVQVTADVQQFGPIAGLVVFILAVRSRRPVVWRRLHAIDATRVHLTTKWVVSFSILRPFGPFPVNTMLRAGEHVVHVHGRFE